MKEKTTMRNSLAVFMALALTSLLSIQAKTTNTPEVKNEIPEQVTAWINSELSKAKNKSFLTDENFFCRDTAKLIGYIKGYDANAGFKTGLIYLDNELTNEQYPVVAQIEPDGKFEAKCPMIHPVKTFITLGKTSIDFYIEPGQTLAIILTIENRQIQENQDTVNSQFKDIFFMGPSAKICSDLTKYKIKSSDYGPLSEVVKKVTPNEFLKKERSMLKENLDDINTMEKSGIYHPKTIELWKNQVYASSGAILFRFETEREDAKSRESNQILGTPITLDYYDFLKDMPLNDPRMLVTCEFKFFMNYFEYGAVFGDVLNCLKSKPFSTFLIEDKKISVTDDERDADLFMENYRLMEKTPDYLAKSKGMYRKKRVLLERYPQELIEYDEYQKNFDRETVKEKGLLFWHIKDSILLNDLKMEQNLTYEISKIRDLKLEFERLNKIDAFDYYKTIRATITNKFLQEEGQRLLLKNFPEQEKTAYELPKGKASDIFKKIIDPHIGKVLIIDFWDIFCSPCVAQIEFEKAHREMQKNNDKMDYLFITSEGGSPKDRYQTFVKEQDLVNTYRLSDDDFNMLRQLFNFNAKPHFVIIDKVGKVEGNYDSEGYNNSNFEKKL